PGDELVSVQLAIHPFEALITECTLNFAVVRELLETPLEDRTGILNRASDGSEQFQLHMPVPPLDLRLFAEIYSRFFLNLCGRLGDINQAVMRLRNKHFYAPRTLVR